MVQICFLKVSKFFLLIEEKYHQNKHQKVNIVSNMLAELILIDEESLSQGDLLQILPLYEDKKVILFVDKHSGLDVLALLGQGVDSIFYKNNTVLVQLPEILEKIKYGEFFLPPGMTKSFVGKIIQLKNSEHDRFLYQVQDVECHLTLKQAEVAALMKHGLSNKEIARLLGIPGGSVKVHVSHIYSKLGQTDRELAIEKLIRLSENIY